MARMHSRKGGKSKSVKPDREGVPEWVPYSKQEVEEIILKLFKEGNNPSRIGLLLRDQYGVPDVRPIMGMKLTHVLEKNNVGLKLPEDLQNIINKSVALRSHLDKHKKDTHNRRSMNLMESKIRRLSKYYIRSGKLPKDWRYDPEQARLLVSK
jgi:small subunit ribosomal protein S15